MSEKTPPTRFLVWEPEPPEGVDFECFEPVGRDWVDEKAFDVVSVHARTPQLAAVMFIEDWSEHRPDNHFAGEAEHIILVRGPLPSKKLHLIEATSYYPEPELQLDVRNFEVPDIASDGTPLDAARSNPAFQDNVTEPLFGFRHDE